MSRKRTRPTSRKEEIKEQKKEKDGIVETIVGSFSDPIGLVKQNGKKFFAGLLKLFLILLLISVTKVITTTLVIQSIIPGGVQNLSPETLSSLTEAQLNTLLLTTPIFMIMQIIELITMIMIYQVAHDTKNNVDMKIFENFKRIGVRGIILFLIIIIINLSLFFTINLGLDVTLLGIVLMLVLFLIQFMIVELVVANNGIIKSIKNSVITAKNNLSKTIIMDGILVMLVIFITASYTQILQNQNLDFYLYAVISVFTLTLTSTILMVPHYFFWSRVKSE